MLSVEQLCADLGRSFRLQELSFSVAPGERVAVLGPNGAGKSTLLELVAGLRAPRSGRIARGETVLSQGRRVLVPPGQRGVGLLLQEGALFAHLSVEANVALGLPRHTARAERRELVERALSAVQIAGLGERRVPSLSGGEQQRVALARTLAQQPGVMLLDEPFHSLDGPLKRQILAELRALVAARRIATLLVTHDLEEAAAFSDRILLLRAGRLVQQGSFEQLYRQPASSWVASFFGEVQVVGEELARLAGLELPAERPAGAVSFRPEDLVLTVAADGLEVDDVRGQGPLLEVTLRLPDGSSRRARVPAHSAITAGVRVRAWIVRALPATVREVEPS